jgi:hypothetical protein
MAGPTALIGKASDSRASASSTAVHATQLKNDLVAGYSRGHRLVSVISHSPRATAVTSSPIPSR